MVGWGWEDLDLVPSYWLHPILKAEQDTSNPTYSLALGEKLSRSICFYAETEMKLG